MTNTTVELHRDDFKGGYFFDGLLVHLGYTDRQAECLNTISLSVAVLGDDSPPELFDSLSKKSERQAAIIEKHFCNSPNP